MVRTCCALGCSAKEGVDEKNGASFHKFPLEPKLAELWEKATQQKIFSTSKSSVLCSRHFIESDFVRYEGKPRRLKPSAVPSVALFPTQLMDQNSQPIPTVVEQCDFSASPALSNHSEMGAQCKKEDVDLLMKVESDDNEMPCSPHCPKSSNQPPINPSISRNADNEYCRRVLSELWKYRVDGFLCDVTLIIGDESLKAHRAILAATSPLLKAAIKSQESSNHCLLNLSGFFDVETLELALQYMYTGSLLLPMDYVELTGTKAVTINKERMATLLNNFKVLGLNAEWLETMEVKVQIDSNQLSSSTSFSDLISRTLLQKTTTPGCTNSDKSKLFSVPKKNPPKWIPPSDHDYIVTGGPQLVRRTTTCASIVNLPSKDHCYNMQGSKFGRKTHPLLAKFLQTSKYRYIAPKVKKRKRTTCASGVPPCTKSTTQSLPSERSVLTVVLRGKREDLSVNSSKNQETIFSQVKPHSHLLMKKRVRYRAREREERRARKQLNEKENLSFIKDISYAEEDSVCDSRDIINDLIDSNVAAQELAVEGDVDSDPSTTEKKIAENKSALQMKRKEHGHVLSEKTVPCTHCPMLFSTQSRLSLHLSRLGLPRPIHKCHICDVVFKEPCRLKRHIAWKHMNGEGARKFTCTTCGRSFSFRENLKRHEIMHTDHRPHLCHLCGKGFIQKISLDGHMRIHHSVKRSEWGRRHPRSGLWSIQKWFCSVCNNTCEGSGGMSTLITECMASHPDVPPNVVRICDVITTPKMEVSDYIGYLCEMCGKNFSTAKDLRRHIVIHSAANPLSCEVCAKVFTSSQAFRLHTRLHTGEKPFLCSACNSAFISKGALTMHLTRSQQCALDPKLDEIGKAIVAKIMSGGGPLRYRCTMCNKTFGARQGLVTHERVHTNQRPYECRICEHKFKQRNHLMFHMEMHAGLKSNVCKLCDKAYRSPVDLRYHYARFHHVNVKKETINNRTTYTVDLPPSCSSSSFPALTVESSIDV